MYISSIDSLRVIAMLAVVMIHAFAFWPFPSIYDPLQLLARFAVPFFFITSGYLFSRKHINTTITWPSIWRPVRRLCIIFLIWSCIYALVPILMPNHWSTLSQQGLGQELLKQIHHVAIDVGQRPTFYLLEGPGFHLWFLPALAMILCLLALALRFNQLKLFVVAGVLLFIAGLLAKAYANTPWGWHVGFNARNGLFFGTVFVALGAWLARRPDKPSMGVAIIIFCLGYLLQFFEAQYLHALNPQMPVAGNDFLIGTLPLGIGAFLIALAQPTLMQRSYLHKLAPYVIGIYVLHILIRDLLEPIRDDLPFYYISWAFLTFVLSLFVTMLLQRIPGLRQSVQ